MFVIRRYRASGYDEFKSTLAQLSRDREKAIETASNVLTFILYSASFLPNTTTSWCPDCIKAIPMVEERINNLEQNLNLPSSSSLFIQYLFVQVGLKDVWKNPQNGFRTDPNIRLAKVPTLSVLDYDHRLVEEQCADPKLLDSFFQSVLHDHQHHQ